INFVSIFSTSRKLGILLFDGNERRLINSDNEQTQKQCLQTNHLIFQSNSIHLHHIPFYSLGRRNIRDPSLPRVLLLVTLQSTLSLIAQEFLAPLVHPKSSDKCLVFLSTQTLQHSRSQDFTLNFSFSVIILHTFGLLFQSPQKEKSPIVPLKFQYFFPENHIFYPV